MSNLTVMKIDGQYVVDSRDVALMVSKQHKDLLESIRVYEGHLLSGKFRPVDFFIPNTYEDSTGRILPCYWITRKGCDMVANKMTGEKGVLFTAAYVTKFEEMERAQSEPKLPQTYAEALRELADVWEQNQKLLPKGQAYDQFMSAKNSQTMGEVAKVLGIGRNNLFSFLRNKKILMGSNVPYQEYMDRGYFEVIEKPISMGDNSINRMQTFATPKGVEYIGKILEREGVIP